MHAMVFIHKFCINCLITIQYKDITTLPTTGAINTFEILSILIRLSIVTISIIMIIKDEKAVVVAATVTIEEKVDAKEEIKTTKEEKK